MKRKADPISAVLAFGLILILTLVMAACTPQSKPTPIPAALVKAKNIQMSDVTFDGMPLTMAIGMLQSECAKRDPARKGIPISLGPDAKQFADVEVNLKLKDTNLAEALEHIADSVGLKLQATETELLLVGKNAK
jgi:hypothetical protein